MLLAGEVRSLERASIVYERLCGQKIPAKTIGRLVMQIGSELVDLRDADEGSPFEQKIEEPPKTAVVECDGGRIMTRGTGLGVGVHDQAWKETKCAGLFRMTDLSFDHDPQSDLPPAFCNRSKVAQLAEKPAPEADDASKSESLSDGSGEDPKDKTPRPRPLHRTCLASMENSVVFGLQMEREAKRRRFFEAVSQAFLGDGLPWNWSIWERYFKSFIPILDFIHVVSYLYRAALVMLPEQEKAWTLYRALAQLCWQGEVKTVIKHLADHLRSQGVDPENGCDKESEWHEVFVTWRYLGNNVTRMDYPRYRQQGLPVTSSLMESLVKQINMRTKGTEMFWNRGVGAESILQIRAAVLCDDNRLQDYLSRRPGRKFVRPKSKQNQKIAA